MAAVAEQHVATTITTIDSAIAELQNAYEFLDDAQTETATTIATGLRDQRDALNGLLQDAFGIDYDSAEAPTLIIKEGSTVTVLVDHMKGMLGTSALVRGYAPAAMLADVDMDGGKGHKWLIDGETELGAPADSTTADATSEPATMDMG